MTEEELATMPQTLEVAAKRRARGLASTALFSRSSIVAITLGVSQALWLFCSASPGGTRLGWELRPNRLLPLTCVGEGGPGGRLERYGGRGHE